jgi:hypothetical protein
MKAGWLFQLRKVPFRQLGSELTKEQRAVCGVNRYDFINIDGGLGMKALSKTLLAGVALLAAASLHGVNAQSVDGSVGVSVGGSDGTNADGSVSVGGGDGTNADGSVSVGGGDGTNADGSVSVGGGDGTNADGSVSVGSGGTNADGSLSIGAGGTTGSGSLSAGSSNSPATTSAGPAGGAASTSGAVAGRPTADQLAAIGRLSNLSRTELSSALSTIDPADAEALAKTCAEVLSDPTDVSSEVVAVCMVVDELTS